MHSHGQRPDNAADRQQPPELFPPDAGEHRAHDKAGGHGIDEGQPHAQQRGHGELEGKVSDGSDQPAQAHRHQQDHPAAGVELARALRIVHGLGRIVAQQRVQRHAEQLRDILADHQIGQAFRPLPLGNRFIGIVQLFRQLGLRHARLLAAGGDVARHDRAQFGFGQGENPPLGWFNALSYYYFRSAVKSPRALIVAKKCAQPFSGNPRARPAGYPPAATRADACAAPRGAKHRAPGQSHPRSGRTGSASPSACARGD